MKRLLFTCLILSSLLACNSKKVGSMQVELDVQGLKKGTLYLQKVVDTLIATVDSVKVKGSKIIHLSDEVISPEIYYITLSNSDKKIIFFGEKGKIKIRTKLDKFALFAQISGSKTQKLLDEYNNMISKFNNKQLDLIQANFIAQQAKNKGAIDSLDRLSKSLIKRRYLYATNFAVMHSKSAVAPYIALSDLYNANVSLLDTINKSLSKKIKASKYGKKLEAFITEIKKEEEQ